MKLILIHGLGSRPRTPLFEHIEKKVGLPAQYLDYCSLMKKGGWMRSVLNHLRDQVPEEPHVLIGHSLGALLSLYLQNKHTKALVLLSPALSLHISVRLGLMMDINTKGHFYLDLDCPTELNKKDMSIFFDLMKNAYKPFVPSIFVVGDEDQFIDIDKVRKFFRTIRREDSWFVEMSKAGHNFSGRYRDVCSVVCAFLSSRGLIPE